MTVERRLTAKNEGMDPGIVFDELARLLYSGDDYDQLHQAICDAAVRLVDGCDHASIMLAQGGALRTAAASDDTARRIDQLEREIGEGPCVDAIHQDGVHFDRDLSAAPTWPRLSERIVAETTVRGMAGFRLLVDDRKMGALNLFSNQTHGLTEDSVDQGALLAAFASVALIAAAHQEQARTLRDGLASNREIGKAIGLMMAFHKVDDQAAFEILRRASQEMNLKLSEIAGQVIDHHNKRPTT